MTMSEIHSTQHVYAVMKHATSYTYVKATVRSALAPCARTQATMSFLFTICGEAFSLSCVNAEACLTGWPNA